MRKKLQLIILILAISVVDLLFRNVFTYNRGENIITTITRGYTSSFVHWDNSHLFWNMFALLLIGLILMEYNEKLFWLGVTISPIFIGLTVHFFCPETIHYCGFSGVSFTLITLTCGCLIDSAKISLKIYGYFTLVGLLLKVVWELTSGSAIFAEASTFFVQTESHLAGALVGIVIYTMRRKFLTHSKTLLN